jgi:hypothetical protein
LIFDALMTGVFAFGVDTIEIASDLYEAFWLAIALELLHWESDRFLDYLID